MNSTKNPGRFAGLLYIALSLPGVYAMVYVPSKLIVHGNAGLAAQREYAREFPANTPTVRHSNSSMSVKTFASSHESPPVRSNDLVIFFGSA